MRKTYAVKPADEIELVFDDGKTLLLRFNAAATYHFANDLGGSEAATEGISTPELGALIMCACSMDNNDDVTLERCRGLVCQMESGMITDIIYAFYESNGVTKEYLREMQKKTMESFIKRVAQKR